MNKVASKIVGEAITRYAQAVVPQLTQTIEQVVTDNTPSKLPPTPAQVQAVVVRLTTQDSALASKRVWAFALPVLSTLGYALLDPSLIGAFVGWLQAHPGAWWGVAADVVAIALPLISKVLDQRPTR